MLSGTLPHSTSWAQTEQKAILGWRSGRRWGAWREGEAVWVEGARRKKPFKKNEGEREEREGGSRKEKHTKKKEAQSDSTTDNERII